MSGNTTSCKCEDVTLYEDDGHRCKRCYREFVPKTMLDTALRDLGVAKSQIVKQVVCWRNHPNISCGCPYCKPVKERE